MSKLPRLWSVFAILAVISIWAISAICNAFAGWNLAGTAEIPAFNLFGYTISGLEPVRGIFAGASVSLDVIKAVSLFALVAALSRPKKRWLVAGGAILFFALASVWSLRSATFTASYALLTSQEQREVMAELQQSRRDLLKTQQARAGFLAQQTVKSSVKVTGLNARYRSGRNAIAHLKEVKALDAKVNAKIAADYESAINGIKQAQHELETKPIVSTADPIVVLAGKLFEIKDEHVILTTSLLFALILEIVSSCGFILFARASERHQGIAQDGGQKDEPVDLPAPKEEEEELPLAATGDPDTEKEEVANDNGNIIPFEKPAAEKKPDKPVNPAQRAALAKLVIKADVHERLHLLDITRMLNNALPIGEGVKSSRATLDLLYSLGWEKTDKALSGGKVWVYGIRLVKPGERTAISQAAA